MSKLLNNIVVDVETWGLGDDAVLVSLGAARLLPGFDPKEPLKRLDTFYTAIDPEQARYGRTMTAGTILWWMAPERREALDRWLVEPKVTLDEALDAFAQWCHNPDEGILLDENGMIDPEPIIYGNGAVFDNVKIRRAMEACLTDYPAKFYNDLCYRSVVRARPDIKRAQIGTHHNALDDAISELIHMVAVDPIDPVFTGRWFASK